MNTTRKLGVLCLAGLVLAGCGTDPGDRGLSGGLLGAGTGAAIGALAGNAATGALVGGLGGAAIGVLTSSNSIDLEGRCGVTRRPITAVTATMHAMTAPPGKPGRSA